MIRFVNPNANAELTDWLRPRIDDALGGGTPHSVECLPASVRTIASPADAARAQACLADWMTRQPIDATVVVLASIDTGVAEARRAGRRAHGFFELVLGDHARRGQRVRLLTVGAAMTDAYLGLVRAHGLEQAVAGIDTVDEPVEALSGPTGTEALARRAEALIEQDPMRPLWIVGVATLPAADAVRARLPVVVDPIRCMIRELRQRSPTECTTRAKTTRTRC